MPLLMLCMNSPMVISKDGPEACEDHDEEVSSLMPPKLMK